MERNLYHHIGKVACGTDTDCSHLSSQALSPWKDMAVVGEGTSPSLSMCVGLCVPFTNCQALGWTSATAMKALFLVMRKGRQNVRMRCSVSDSDRCC